MPLRGSPSGLSEPRWQRCLDIRWWPTAPSSTPGSYAECSTLLRILISRLSAVAVETGPPPRAPRSEAVMIRSPTVEVVDHWQNVSDLVLAHSATPPCGPAPTVTMRAP